MPDYLEELAATLGRLRATLIGMNADHFEVEIDMINDWLGQQFCDGEIIEAEQAADEIIAECYRAIKTVQPKAEA
jgi:hypothetical protein